ncbi:hypothetical protein [Amycolatopsis sp. CA-230715]|uniref:hypothetical protein n=1 Tax=Amycolatopsis sp. CA-230715 TaxID=2745196 RepID=UPI001C00C7CC|nr:hypothetical protein [Amycolatopsis sp. CA-230715]QWF76935.1 hypothetical protein HUW46_00315 [Amycolatopsis sp. CA-230715]
MSGESRNPVIDDWLSDQHGAAVLMETAPLTGLAMASYRAEEVPDGILGAWALEIVRARRIVNQSEPTFIRQARDQGWSWQQIADRLGLPSAEAAAMRCDELDAELARTDPSNDARPWQA